MHFASNSILAKFKLDESKSVYEYTFERTCENEGKGGKIKRLALSSLELL